MQPDVREYLAAERTLLSYARTAIGLMGFGFVVARFSLFMRELRVMGLEPTMPIPGISMWIGTGVIVFSVALNVVAVLEYRSMVRRLNEANRADWQPSRLAIATAILLAAMGILLAGNLAWSV